MLSWLITLRPAWRARRPATCSGDQPLARGSRTARRRSGSRSRREPDQRRARVLFLGVTRFVTDVTAAIAPHLARDRRWRAIQSCRDLPDRAATGLKSGNLASVVQ